MRATFRIAALALLGALMAGVAIAQPTSMVEVEISRIKPKREKHPTLSFLKENRDFIRARIDLLREKSFMAEAAPAPLDPRFLAYDQMLAAVHAGRDSATQAEESRARTELYASVRDLAKLEDQLDQIERLLASQRSRLGVIEQDFTGLQGTAWLVVLTGRTPAPIDAVVITMEDGRVLTAELDQPQRDLLERGGALELAHARIEPREQLVTLRIVGRGWAADADGYLTLTPERDRLMFLRLDLTGATPEAGAPGVRATRWTHDPSMALQQGTAGTP